MDTIYAEFQRFRDVNLVELIGATGVYVIWDARAKARPTYIGEGNILKRITDHVKRHNRRFAHHWNGYVAIIAGTSMNPPSLNVSYWTWPRRRIASPRSTFIQGKSAGCFTFAGMKCSASRSQDTIR